MLDPFQWKSSPFLQNPASLCKALYTQVVSSFAVRSLEIL
jgi:hypothetical protein